MHVQKYSSIRSGYQHSRESVGDHMEISTATICRSMAVWLSYKICMAKLMLIQVTNRKYKLLETPNRFQKMNWILDTAYVQKLKNVLTISEQCKPQTTLLQQCKYWECTVSDSNAVIKVLVKTVHPVIRSSGEQTPQPLNYSNWSDSNSSRDYDLRFVWASADWQLCVGTGTVFCIDFLTPELLAAESEQIYP